MVGGEGSAIKIIDENVLPPKITTRPFVSSWEYFRSAEDSVRDAYHTGLSVFFSVNGILPHPIHKEMRHRTIPAPSVGHNEQVPAWNGAMHCFESVNALFRGRPRTLQD